MCIGVGSSASWVIVLRSAYKKEHVWSHLNKNLHKGTGFRDQSLVVFRWGDNLMWPRTCLFNSSQFKSRGQFTGKFVPRFFDQKRLFTWRDLTLGLVAGTCNLVCADFRVTGQFTYCNSRSASSTREFKCTLYSSKFLKELDKMLD